MLNVDYSTPKRFYMSLGITLMFLGSILLIGSLTYFQEVTEDLETNANKAMESLSKLEKNNYTKTSEQAELEEIKKEATKTKILHKAKNSLWGMAVSIILFTFGALIFFIGFFGVKSNEDWQETYFVGFKEKFKNHNKIHVLIYLALFSWMIYVSIKGEWYYWVFVALMFVMIIYWIKKSMEEKLIF